MLKTMDLQALLRQRHLPLHLKQAANLETVGCTDFLQIDRYLSADSLHPSLCIRRSSIPRFVSMANL